MTTGQIILIVIAAMLVIGAINGFAVEQYERRRQRRIFGQDDWPI